MEIMPVISPLCTQWTSDILESLKCHVKVLPHSQTHRQKSQLSLTVTITPLCISKCTQALSLIYTFFYRTVFLRMIVILPYGTCTVPTEQYVCDE